MYSPFFPAVPSCAIALLLSLPPAACLAAAAPGSASDQDLRVLAADPAFADRGIMLMKHLARLPQEGDWSNDLAIAGIRSEREWAAYRDRGLAALGRILPLPVAGIPPHDVKVAGVLERDSYRVEKILYQSVPGLYVSANVYVPRTGSPPYPAVMIVPGHSEEGKALPDYQRAAQGLVQWGFVVLIYDPLGQGERVQFLKPDGSVVTGDCMIEHTQLANQLWLTGTPYPALEISDALRGIDYLLTRRDVDPERIGTVGHSLGGWVNTVLTALDPRIRASVIAACPLFPEHSFIGGAGPEESAHGPLGMIAAGVTAPSLLINAFPRPIRVIRESAGAGGGVDQATRSTVARVRSVDRVLGVPDRLSLVEVEGPHPFLQEMREPMYEWFNRWLRGQPDQREERAGRIEPAEALFCTPSGRLARERGQSLPEWARARADAVLPRYPVSADEPDFLQFKRQIATNVQLLLNNPGEPREPVAVPLGQAQSHGFSVEKLALYTEQDIYVPALHYRARSGSDGRLVVLADGEGKTTDGGALAGALAEAGFSVLAVDLRGMGETKVTRRQRHDQRGGLIGRTMGQEAIAAHQAMAMGRTVFAMRVFDLLRVIEHVCSSSQFGRPDAVAVIGRGACGPIALHAAVLDNRIQGILTDGSLGSFMDLIRPQITEYHLMDHLPGVLQFYDLPHLAGALAPRPLWLLNSLDARRERIPSASVRNTYAFTDGCYGKRGSADAFQIREYDAENERLAACVAWARSVFK